LSGETPRCGRKRRAERELGRFPSSRPEL
jgi:hypothetical protein